MDNDTSIENPVSLMEAFTVLQTVHRFVMQDADSGNSLETVERLTFGEIALTKNANCLQLQIFFYMHSKYYKCNPAYTNT